MIFKLLLGLRNNGHQVNIVKINGENRPVLGTSHPEEEDRRNNVLRQWGMRPQSPRQERPATIDQPLPQRAQTILSHQLSPEARQKINGGMTGLASSRRQVHSGTKESLYPLPDAND